MTYSITRGPPSSSTRVLRAIVIVVLLSVLYLGTAHSQDAVAVTDQDVVKNTGKVETNTDKISKQVGGSTSSDSSDTVNGHLKNIDTVDNGNAPASSSSAVAAPRVALVNMPSPDTSQCNSVAKAQMANCIEILETENSQYQYMKAMYDNTSSREKDLKALIAQRQALRSEDYGKVEDNTNKMIALRAQMDIDRQQMESVNNVYSLRLNYLRAQQTRLAQAASSGSTDSIVTNTIGQIVSGAVLKAALTLQQTSNGAQTLSIENTNGF